jgi:tetrahydromethanopterin S-methyltransferase subunit B
MREEIDAKAAILAQSISKDKVDHKVKELNEKIEELEQQIRLADQHQIEFDHKDSRKT